MLSESALFTSLPWAVSHAALSRPWGAGESLVAPGEGELAHGTALLLSLGGASLGTVHTSRGSPGVFHWSTALSLGAALGYLAVGAGEYRGLGVYTGDSCTGSPLAALPGLHPGHVLVGPPGAGGTGGTGCSPLDAGPGGSTPLDTHPAGGVGYWHLVEGVYLCIYAPLYPRCPGAGLPWYGTWATVGPRGVPAVPGPGQGRHGVYAPYTPRPPPVAPVPAPLPECNHKTLDPYYPLLGLGAGASGTGHSLVLRAELGGSGARVVPPENQCLYNLVLTAHGALMVFFLVMPVLYGGLGNYLVPVQGGSPEVGLPRANGPSLLLLAPVSLSLLVVAQGGEYPGGTGWTLYPPLSLSLPVPVQVCTTVAALGWNGLSSFLGSTNFYGTLSQGRSPGGALGVQYPFPASVSALFLLLLLALPVLSGSLGALVSDTGFNTVYLDPALGGDPVLYQHLFWFFGHPEVYILIVPASGALSHTVSGLAGALPVYGAQSTVLALGSIALLGTLVWGHHMYATGPEGDTRGYYTGITVMISLPTGTKLANWAYTATGGAARGSLSPGYLYPVLVAVMFTTGGSTGVVLGNAAADLSLHDSYYVVAHFHFILSLGAPVSLLAGVLYWQGTLGGYGLPSLPSPGGVYLYTGVGLGVAATFLPLHLLGWEGRSRRGPGAGQGGEGWGALASLGSGATVLSLLVARPGAPRHPPPQGPAPYQPRGPSRVPTPGRLGSLGVQGAGGPGGQGTTPSSLGSGATVLSLLVAPAGAPLPPRLLAPPPVDPPWFSGVNSLVPEGEGREGPYGGCPRGSRYGECSGGSPGVGPSACSPPSPPGGLLPGG